MASVGDGLGCADGDAAGDAAGDAYAEGEAPGCGMPPESSCANAVIPTAARRAALMSVAIVKSNLFFFRSLGIGARLSYLIF